VSFDGVALIETFQSDLKDHRSLTKVVARKLSNPIMVDVLTPKRRHVSNYAYSAARQRAIDLASGRGPAINVREDPTWEGVPANHPNDDRRRTIVWCNGGWMHDGVVRPLSLNNVHIPPTNLKEFSKLSNLNKSSDPHHKIYEHVGPDASPLVPYTRDRVSGRAPSLRPGIRPENAGKNTRGNNLEPATKVPMPTTMEEVSHMVGEALGVGSLADKEKTPLRDRIRRAIAQRAADRAAGVPQTAGAAREGATIKLWLIDTGCGHD